MAEKTTPDWNSELLYQADEQPPKPLAFGLGMQFTLLSLGGIVLMPTIAFRTAGADESTVAWAVFASLIIAGVITGLQAFPIKRFGAGYVLSTGATAAAIAVTVDALAAGGAPLFATLVVVSAILQFIFSYRISMFRRIITPTVSGIILMLIPVTIAPIVSDRLAEVSPGHLPSEGLICALVTTAVIVVISLRGNARLRPWAPIIGIISGGVVAGAYGLIDLDTIAQASWLGLPSTAWPKIGVDLGPSFWGLLPAFMLVSISCSIRSISAALAIQDVSWHKTRAPDLRAVQGAVAADALANLLSGLGGTIMNSTRSTTVALIINTQVASRFIGLTFGLTLVAFAFVPKATALVLALPPSVLAAYLIIMTATLFVKGMQLVVSGGLNYSRMLITGLSFWIGASCQFGLLLPDKLPLFAGGLFNNGLAAGGITAITMTILMEFTGGRRRSLETYLKVSCLPELRKFAAAFGNDSGFTQKMLMRLDAVVEETLLTLLEDQTDDRVPNRSLKVTAHVEGGDAVLEFIARSSEGNIEDRIALLDDVRDSRPAERDISLHLLRHLASEVQHRQYHDIDLITVRVESSKGNTRT